MESKNHVISDLKALGFLNEEFVHEIELFFINSNLSHKERLQVINFLKKAGHLTIKKYNKNEQ